MPTARRVLLHICCAPDATIPWPALRDEAGEKLDVTGFFYGNNIHPEGEWALRRDAVSRLSGLLSLPSVIMPYKPDMWLCATRAYAGEPEGGARCAICFRLQLEAAADYARREDYSELCTTLTISPHKSPALLNEIGRDVAGAYGLRWIERIWRKNDGFKRSVAQSREMGLYRQNYCGCMYSMRNGG